MKQLFYLLYDRKFFYRLLFLSITLIFFSEISLHAKSKIRKSRPVLKYNCEYAQPLENYVVAQSFGGDHFGVDLGIASDPRTEKGPWILSPCDGFIYKVDDETTKRGKLRGWGHYVVVQCDCKESNQTIRFLFAHLLESKNASSVPLERTVVRKGTPIAISDDSGDTTAPHVHTEASVILSDKADLGPDNDYKIFSTKRNPVHFWKTNPGVRYVNQGTVPPPQPVQILDGH